MKFKKMMALVCSVVMLTAALSGCGSTGTSDATPTTEATPTEGEATPTVGEVTPTEGEATPTEGEGTPEASLSGNLKLAIFDGGYGVKMWEDVIAKFKDKNPDVTIELTAEKNLEEVIMPLMQAQDYPDFVYLSTSRELALPETLLKSNGIMDITDVLGMKVMGEDVTVGEKIIPGFTDTLVTNPYNDGKTYLAPTFYSPCGLWFNEGLFTEKGWTVPETWDEMWELGDKAKAEGISLFTYPVAGYFDAFIFGLLTEVGGADFYNRAMSYEDGIWETPEATEVFKLVEKLATYMEPTTVGNANKDNFAKNQQLILDNKALFMPNGNWIITEMSEAPRAENFKWGFTALPAMKDGGDRYSFTFFEQMWIPANAENPDLAKAFMTYLYSDEAVEIFAKNGAIQPVEGVSQYITDEESKLVYSIYDNGAKASMGGFAATEAVEGVSMKDTLFFTIDSIVSGDKTVEEWQKSVEEVSDKLREAMK